VNTNTSLNLAPLFALGDNAFWPTLTRRQAIPAALASSPQPVVGLGLVKALWALLCHTNGVAIEAPGGQPPCWQIWLSSSSSNGVHELSGNPQTWHIKFQGYLVALAGALDAVCASFPDHPAYGMDETTAFLRRWQELLSSLVTEVQALPPYTEAQLRSAASNPTVNEAMMAASDALFAYLEFRKVMGVSALEMGAQSYLSANATSLALLYQQSAPTATSAPAVPVIVTEVTRTLLRAIMRGRTALVVGPTGAGKTEAVKHAALAAGAILVKVEGHPGLDDKILFGGVYPDGKGGFNYVEGPLTEAWRYAAEGQRVVLLLDELARMDALYHALLIGALDTLSGAEIAARPKLARASTQLPFVLKPAERYRVLNLPSGTVLIAPADHLSVIATTNLGSAYQQASSQLDPALLRRFALRLEVERLTEDERRAILEQSLPAPVARALVAVEEFSIANTASQGGLLAEALNLGVLLDWGQEAQALVNDGTLWPQALVDAARYTALPFCCPRLSDGRLEPPAVNMLRSEIIVAARSL